MVTCRIARHLAPVIKQRHRMPIRYIFSLHVTTEAPGVGTLGEEIEADEMRKD